MALRAWTLAACAAWAAGCATAPAPRARTRAAAVTRSVANEDFVGPQDPRSLPPRRPSCALTPAGEAFLRAHPRRPPPGAAPSAVSPMERARECFGDFAVDRTACVVRALEGGEHLTEPEARLLTISYASTQEHSNWLRAMLEYVSCYPAGPMARHFCWQIWNIAPDEPLTRSVAEHR